MQATYYALKTARKRRSLKILIKGLRLIILTAKLFQIVDSYSALGPTKHHLIIQQGFQETTHFLMHFGLYLQVYYLALGLTKYHLIIQQGFQETTHFLMHFGLRLEEYLVTQQTTLKN